MPRRWVYPVCLWCCLSCLLAMPGSAMAHTRLLATQPTAGVELDRAPEAIRLTFSSAPLPRMLKIEIARDADWQPLAASLQGKVVKAPLPPLTPGQYRIRWSVISNDGHRQNGSFGFRIR